MTILEYIPKALAFERRGMTPEARRVHAALGLVTEMFELINANSFDNLVEELGDLCWFAALACDTCGGYVEHPRRSAWRQDIIGFVDLVKQEHAYSRANMEHMGYQASCILYSIYDTRAAEANLRKLAARYKQGKFSFESALMRDVAAEYAALGGAK